MSTDPCSYMNEGAGDHYTVDWGCVWLHGRSVQSPCVRAWAAALAERLRLSVTHRAAAV